MPSSLRPSLQRSSGTRRQRESAAHGRLWIILGWLLGSAAIAASPSVELEVEARKKTAKTSEAGSVTSKTSHYVERTVLQVTARSAGPAVEAEVATYFVARNVQTHAQKYCGHERHPLVFSGVRKTLVVESQPVGYSQNKDRNSTREAKRGAVTFGWVVIVSAGGEEVAVKASAPEVLQWVRRNPPRSRN